MSPQHKSRKKMYYISGLGVDSRVFKRIDLNEYEMIHVNWIAPHRKESLETYSKRLFESVAPKDSYSVMGVSFGGMIAQEWAKIQQPKHLILISTAFNSTEISLPLRIGGKLGLTGLMSPRIALLFPRLLYYYFGVNSLESKQLLKDIIRETDARFMRWAAKALLNWTPSKQPLGIRIHGQKDKIIPAPNHSNLELKNSGHFCIYDDGIIISQFINTSLSV